MRGKGALALLRGRDFPSDAQRWGFEGVAASEVEFAEDGRVAATRTLYACPPFILGASAGRIAARTRYDPSYVAGGGTCIADRQTVCFRLPQRERERRR